MRFFIHPLHTTQTAILKMGMRLFPLVMIEKEAEEMTLAIVNQGEQHLSVLCILNRTKKKVIRKRSRTKDQRLQTPTILDCGL